MFPIKYIDNNLVWNKDNEVFAYYELIPYNYSFLSPEQKYLVHDSFRQLIAQSREGKIHALQIATESSIRSIQEQSKKLVTGKLREVAIQKIDDQTEALVSMIGDNQVDYRFFLGFKLMVTEDEVNLKNIKKSVFLTFREFLNEVRHTLMNDFVSFDCSGLTQWCYGKAGISLPRTAQAQYDATQHIPLSQAQAGDLVFFHSTYNTSDYVTHVGIYVGNNQMYHAGNPIGYTDLTSAYWQQHIICAGRIKQ